MAEAYIDALCLLVDDALGVGRHGHCLEVEVSLLCTGENQGICFVDYSFSSPVPSITPPLSCCDIKSVQLHHEYERNTL